jgi:hypothetical protein
MAPTKPPGSGLPGRTDGSGRSGRPGSEPAADFLDGDVPEASAEASAAEQARAHSFAALIDKAIAGRTPPALSADERALLEVTTVIRAAAGHAVLSASARRSVVEQALAGALGPAASSGTRTSALMEAGAPPPGRGRAARLLPWALTAGATAIAAAAVAALWLRQPTTVVVSAPAPVPVQWTSRPADALIGEIRREAAGDAAARLDSIYSDRLDGFREATLFRPRGAR